jgi:uncharacterized damage-inducible protein DinB
MEDPHRIVDRLDRFPAAVRAVAAGLPEEEARYRPPSGAWSILEVVNHLADEEAEDFRTRLRLTLEGPTREWPPIDPEGWAVSRGYNERDLAESIERFARERAESIAWLRGLRNPDWSRAHTHPRAGPLSAGELLASWAAHDSLHLRQIAKRLHELAALHGHGTGYAGDWGP